MSLDYIYLAVADLALVSLLVIFVLVSLMGDVGNIVNLTSCNAPVSRGTRRSSHLCSGFAEERKLLKMNNYSCLCCQTIFDATNKENAVIQSLSNHNIELEKLTLESEKRITCLQNEIVRLKYLLAQTHQPVVGATDTCNTTSDIEYNISSSILTSTDDSISTTLTLMNDALSIDDDSTIEGDVTLTASSTPPIPSNIGDGIPVVEIPDLTLFEKSWLNEVLYNFEMPEKDDVILAEIPEDLENTSAEQLIANVSVSPFRELIAGSSQLAEDMETIEHQTDQACEVHENLVQEESNTENQQIEDLQAEEILNPTTEEVEEVSFSQEVLRNLNGKDEKTDEDSTKADKIINTVILGLELKDMISNYEEIGNKWLYYRCELLYQKLVILKNNRNLLQCERNVLNTVATQFSVSYHNIKVLKDVLAHTQYKLNNINLRCEQLKKYQSPAIQTIKLRLSCYRKATIQLKLNYYTKQHGSTCMYDPAIDYNHKEDKDDVLKLH